MKLRLKINGVIIFLAVIAVVIFYRFFFRQSSSELIDEVLELLGISFMLLGQIIRISARGYKAEHSKDGGSLIKDGPYSLVRNPMYLGIFLIGLGAVLVFFKWWAAVIFFTFFISRYVLLIFSEEKKLLAIFPEEYRQYQQKVPRIIPSFEMFARRDMGEYLYLRLAWFKREIFQVIIVLSMVIFLESLEDILREGLSSYLAETIPLLTVLILFIALVTYLLKKTKKCLS